MEETDFINVLGRVVMIMRKTKDTDATTLSRSVNALFNPCSVTAISFGRIIGPMAIGFSNLKKTKR